MKFGGSRLLLPAAICILKNKTGQPWLVNALARQIVESLVTDYAVPISPAHVETAKEILIQRRDTHLDSLAERLRDERVRRVIEPVLTGSLYGADVYNDDLLKNSTRSRESEIVL